MFPLRFELRRFLAEEKAVEAEKRRIAVKKWVPVLVILFVDLS